MAVNPAALLDSVPKGLLIAGQWRDSSDGTTLPVDNPANGEVLAHVASATPADGMAALDAAVAAQATWAKVPPRDRGELLRAAYEKIVARTEEFALLMTMEMGKPLAEARGEILYAASFVDWYAEEGRRLSAEGIASHLPDAEMIVRREPLGVAGLVTPWNFPAAMLTRKAGAALAAGCTVVAHPSAETPLSALALAELGQRAGLPAGVLNVVTGAAGTVVGRLCADPRVRVLSFTGSTEIGTMLAGQCAPGMKRLVMELGGHAPLLVFDDADVERAADIALQAKFATSCQDCLAANRIFVQRGIAEAFTRALAARIAALRVGNGLTPGVDIGPLMHARAVAKVEAQVTDAVARGARVVVGGGRLAEGPLFFAPTLLTGIDPAARIMREETFGPVAAVSTFDTEAEAISRANDTDYGLVAYVVTANGARQLRLARALEFGMVAINRVKITGAPVPFGGWKCSGLGREGARHGLEAFTELKYVCIDTRAEAAA